MTETSAQLGLGIDAGGTRTRWAVAHVSGDVIGEGHVQGLTALQMASESGREHIRRAMKNIADQLLPGQQPLCICAGITGVAEGDAALQAIIATEFLLSPVRVALRSDIEITCLDLFAPGEGYVIYAGTGSIAAFIDSTNTFHRSGGRGAIIDDAGGGFWIAIEALRHIWRGEDFRPSSWRESPMAVAMFQRLGGSEWPATRQYVYQRDRGEIGELALAVAATADQDAAAREILLRAGNELARLGNTMLTRFGPRPMALAGRVSQLHPLIARSLRDTLPTGTDLLVRNSEAHIAAARIAAKSIPTHPGIKTRTQQ